VHRVFQVVLLDKSAGSVEFSRCTLRKVFDGPGTLLATRANRRCGPMKAVGRPLREFVHLRRDPNSFLSRKIRLNTYKIGVKLLNPKPSLRREKPIP
jgi:hypothetical protein